jgi:hypothetical protein
MSRFQQWNTFLIRYLPLIDTSWAGRLQSSKCRQTPTQIVIIFRDNAKERLDEASSQLRLCDICKDTKLSLRRAIAIFEAP